MKLKILVIDDEESIRFTFEKFLVKKGYEVVTADKYDKAMDLIENSDFDLIFADIILDGKSGIDILRGVKDRNLNCPVVMITGAPEVDNAAEALRLGAFDYIPKPVCQETLLQVTKAAMEHKALVDEKEKYRLNLEAIFMSVKDAIITVDTNMFLIAVNEAAKNICDLSRGHIGEALSDFPRNCGGYCVEALEETIMEKSPVEIYRFECKHKHRPQQITTITTHPLINNKGLFTGAVLVVKDDTRLVGLEKEMKERRQLHNIIGKSKRMQEVYSIIESLVDVPSTVLVVGESGTGKELVADALHYRGERRLKALVKVNCSALTEYLLESELFGHVKGAFTGAISDRKGRFEVADGGTIFLDEIGDISQNMQSKLLRVLQEKTFERIGDSKSIKVDVRVVTATHQNLLEKIDRGEFRRDLYYRLKVVELNLPPLRDKKEDLLLLVDHFLNKFNKKFNKMIEGISTNVRKIFMGYHWPGNVRELENTLEHAFIVCNYRIITVDHISHFMEKFTKAKPYSVLSFGFKGNERARVLKALKMESGNKTKAACLLGMSRSSLHRKIKKHKIEIENQKTLEDGNG